MTMPQILLGSLIPLVISPELTRLLGHYRGFGNGDLICSGDAPYPYTQLLIDFSLDNLLYYELTTYLFRWEGH